MILPALVCIAALLFLSVAGAFLATRPSGRTIVYGGSLVVSIASLLLALVSLGAAPETVILPIGLPWTGAHFHLDPLAAFFLAVVGLGSAGASLYALGYGRHEHEPQRVLPFYPLFLAGLEPRGDCGRRVQLPVRVGADVAGLLGIGDVAPSRKRQRTRRLCLYRNGQLFRPRPAPVLRVAGRHDRQLRVLNHTCRPPIIRHRRTRTAPGPDRGWFESRRRATARLAAARPSRRAEPCLGAHERRDDQGRRLRFRPHRLRSGRCANLVVRLSSYSLSAASQQCWACCTH